MGAPKRQAGPGKLFPVAECPVLCANGPVGPAHANARPSWALTLRENSHGPGERTLPGGVEAGTDGPTCRLRVR